MANEDAKMTPTPQQRECGYVSLGFAVVEWAVNEVRDLQKAGIIQNGKVCPVWSASITLTARRLGYKSAHDVERLIAWLCNGPAQEWLDMVDSNITAKTIASELGI